MMTGHVQLAKNAIGEYVRSGKTIKVPTDADPQMLNEKAGVFVTIHEGGKLRGCIGTFAPTKKNIAQEIVANSISAATSDPRFFPIEERELPELEIEISVLGEPKLLTDPKKHDPQRTGIIAAANDGRRGLLLPGLEGIDTLEKQVQISCEKGGINSLEEPFDLYCFKTKVFK